MPRPVIEDSENLMQYNITDHDFPGLEVRASTIEGTGLFATQNFRAGDTLFFFNEPVCREADYIAEGISAHPILDKTTARYVGEYLTYDTEIRKLDYFNHSNDPNILFHCRVAFALRDIKAGEEITADYRYILIEAETLTDVHTGQVIMGVDAETALLETTAKLHQVLQFRAQRQIPRAKAA